MGRAQKMTRWKQGRCLNSLEGAMLRDTLRDLDQLLADLAWADGGLLAHEQRARAARETILRTLRE
jgi:hypothetical protein